MVQAERICGTCRKKNVAREQYCVKCGLLLTQSTIIRPPRLGGRLFKITIVLSCLLVLSFLIYRTLPRPVAISPSQCSITATPLPLPPLPTDRIGVYADHCGQENIGLSDGRYVLDAGDLDTGKLRPGLALKEQAADKLSSGDRDGAIALWKQAHIEDSSDAETLIYLEDQRVLSSGTPYVTFVIGTVLPDDPVDAGSRDQLQGAYVAQKEYNDHPELSGGLRVRLLIAKSGNNPINSITVAQQIVQAAQHDKTIVGILGWTKTITSLAVIPIFAKAHIPILSSTAVGDNLTGISKYFFHTTPLNENAAPVLARYTQSLHPKRLIVLEDQQEPFSQNLAQDFTTQFNTDGYQVSDTEQFHTGASANELSGIMTSALQKHPDVIFMAANTSSIYQSLLTSIYDLPATNTLKVISDTSIYPIVDNLQKRPGDVARFHFVSTAFPDEWGVIERGRSAKTPPFFDQQSQQDKFLPGEYSQAFWYSVHPSHEKGDPVYGYIRANAPVMLTYDGLNVLLRGIQIAETGKSVGNITPSTINITPDDLQRSLTTISGAQAFQGITGQISFDGNHDPTDKELLVLYGTKDGLQIEGPDHVYQGCFLVEDLLSRNCDHID